MRPAAAILTLLLVFSSGCSHGPDKRAQPEPVAAAPAPLPRTERPDDEMQVAGTLGTLSDEEIAGPFQRRWDDVSACFDEVHKSRLWYVGGKVEIKIRVGKDGAPKSVYVAASSVGNYEVEHCLLGVARDLTFSKPHGGGEAEFSYPIEMRARATVEEWDEGRVSPHLKKPKPKKDLVECKQKAHDLPPSVLLTLYVAPGGKVTSAGLAAEAPLDEAYATCVTARAKLWRLEDPLGRIAKATVAVAQ